MNFGKEEREENVKDVYEINEKETIMNKKVLIFDDIYTTGSTVNEFSKYLKIKKKIGVFTLAKD